MVDNWWKNLKLGWEDLLLGLQLISGERLMEWDRAGEPDSDVEHEYEEDEPKSIIFPIAANALWDLDPLPPKDTLGE